MSQKTESLDLDFIIKGSESDLNLNVFLFNNLNLQF